VSLQWKCTISIGNFVAPHTLGFCKGRTMLVGGILVAQVIPL